MCFLLNLILGFFGPELVGPFTTLRQHKNMGEETLGDPEIAIAYVVFCKR